MFPSLVHFQLYDHTLQGPRSHEKHLIFIGFAMNFERMLIVVCSHEQLPLGDLRCFFADNENIFAIGKLDMSGSL